MWRATTVRRRLAIPSDVPLLAWAQGDYRGMQVPGRPMLPIRYWPPVLALSPEWLWVSRAGAVRRFALDDVVIASVATRPRGALRLDFMEGGPLVVLIHDDARFRTQLDREIERRNAKVPMGAPTAPGVIELPVELLDEVAELGRRSELLQARAGGDLRAGVEADRLLDAAHERLHQARVVAARARRSATRDSAPPGVRSC